MGETATIPVTTLNSIQRMMNRIRTMLERQELEELITEEAAAAFLEVGVPRLRNMVGDGTIPRNAYVYTINNARKYYKHKLIKS